MADLSFVYFIQSECGEIKIGYTSNPVEVRLHALQRESPLPLKLLAHVAAGRHMETILHGIFKRERLHGEWFEPSTRLLRMVKFVSEHGRLRGYRDPELESELFAFGAG